MTTTGAFPAVCLRCFLPSTTRSGGVVLVCLSSPLRPSQLQPPELLRASGGARTALRDDSLPRSESRLVPALLNPSALPR